MNNRIFLKSLLFTLSLLMTFSIALSSQANAQNVAISVVSTQVDPHPTDPVQVGVPVRMSTDIQLNGGSPGFYFAKGDASVDPYVAIDSVSLTGGMAEGALPQVSIDSANHLGVIGFIYFPGISTPVYPGDSLFGTLWFTVSPAAPDLVLPIDSGWFPPAGDFVLTDEFGNSVNPEFTAGTLTIGSPAAADLDVTPDTLTFNATEGGANPAAQSFDITNVGSGTLDWTASEISAWFDLSAYAGTAPSTVDVTVNIAGLSAGTHVGTVTVDGGSAANSPQDVTIILELDPPPPVIVLSQTEFNFEATEGEKALLYDTLTITNGGGGTLEWAAAKTQAWLTLDPTSGTAPSDMELLANTAGLTVGLYKDSIEISDPDATNSPQKVYVNLTINEPPPEIGLSQALFTFEATEGEKANLYDTLTITNTGGGTLNWTGANAEAWLTIDPTSGAAPSDVELAVTTAGLTAGVYYDTVTISAAGAINTPQKAAVQLTINEPPPEIFVDPSTFTFNVQVGNNPADQLMNISNAGGGTLNFSLSNLEGWLTVTPGAGTAPEVCTLSVVSNALAVGTYYDTITVSAPGATNTPVKVPVTLNVADLDPFIVLSQDQFGFGFTEGTGTYVSSLSITNGGGGTLNWSASNLEAWLSLDPTGGTAPTDVDVSVTIDGLAVGMYYDTITVTSAEATNSPQKIPVTLEIYEQGQFNITSGGEPITQLVFEGETAKSLDPQIINIASTGDALGWGISYYNGAWLSASPESGETPWDVEVSVNIAGLPAGTYYDTLVISEVPLKAADDVEIEVMLILAEPQAEFIVDPTSITFNTDEGVNPASQDLDISSTGSELDWGAVYSGTWLGLSVASGTTPSTIGVSADVTGLGPGTYYDTIAVSEAPGKAAATVYVPVTLNISAVEQPYLSVSPLIFNFEGNQGGANPASQSLSITNLASGTLNWNASYDAGWLSLSQNSGTGNASVDVMIDISGLIADSYIDTITVSDPAATNSPQYVEVNLLVNPPSPQGGDTVWVACDTTLTGQTAEVEITFINDNIIAGIQIPLNFDQTIVSCDSVSFAGSRVDYISTLIGTVDNVEGTINIGVIPTEEELIPVGDGLLATLYFTGLVAGYTDIDTGFIAPASEYVFVDEYVQEFYPEFFVGCVEVEEPSAPCIEVSAMEFFFVGTVGAMDPADQYLTIANCGSGALSWTASNDEVWLTPAPTMGTDDDVITLSVSLAGLPVGGYHDTLTIADPTASNSPVHVLVHLTVNEPGPAMDTVRVISTTVAPSPTDPVSFGVRVELFNLEQINAGSLGFYYDKDNPAVDPYLAIDSVTLTGGAAENCLPQVSIDTDDSLYGVLGFIYFPGMPGQQPVAPGDSLLGTLWFTLSPAAPDMVVPVDSGFFPPAGNFVLTDSEGNSVIPYVIPGEITIGSAPPEVELVVEPDTLFFTGTLGSPNPDPQTFDINALPFGKVLLDWDASFDAPWLSMDPMSGTTPSEPEVSVDLTGLVATTYYETIVITAEEAVNSPQEIVVMFDVSDEPSAGLSGTVVDADGLAPIEDATVDVFDSFGGTLVVSGMTNASGEFAFPTLPNGDYYARAYKNGYYPDAMDVTCPDDGVEFMLTATGDILPTYEWVNFYCDENMLNDELVQVGDVIEAYNPEGFLCGQFFVEVVGQYGFMPVYRDDEYTPEKDGCYPGDPISFTINGYSAATSDDATWTSNGDNVQICLTAYTEYTVCIELGAGWNLISWNVDTDSDDIEDLIADIKGDIDVILGFEAGALTYDPDPAMSEFNTLTAMDHFHGYWFRMDNPAEFCVTGMKVPAATPIALEMGWNLASYLPEEEDEIEHALASIMDYLLVVLGYDGGGLSYQPDLKDFSTLDTLRPEFGYWIKVTDDVMLTYPGDGAPAFAKIIPDMFASERSEITTSNVWINLYGRDVMVDGEPVSAGTQLEAYGANGMLCGTFTVTESGKFGFMPVYGAENGSNDGLQRGDQFSIRVNGQETEETFTFSGSGDRIAVGSLTLKYGGTTPVPERYNLAQNYPNPFNPTTHILYDIPVESRVTLTIYNILGEKVATLVDEVQPAGAYTTVWNGQTDNGSAVSSGIYFYRLTAGDYVKSMKMTLMK